MIGNTALFEGFAEEFGNIVFDTHCSEYDCKFLIGVVSQRSLLYNLCSQLVMGSPFPGEDRKLLASDQGSQSVDGGDTSTDVVTGILTGYRV